MLVSISFVMCLSALGALSPGIQKPVQGPETFTAKAEVKGPAGAATATITIQINRYTPDFDRQTVEKALKGGGYPAFLTALRKAPSVGHIAVRNEQFLIRYARQQTTPKGRSIVVVTEKPLFFVGGGATNARPRAGYEVAVAQFNVDDAGLGSGQMAAAARVKPSGDGGVQIDDYAEELIQLATVSKAIK